MIGAYSKGHPYKQLCRDWSLYVCAVFNNVHICSIVKIVHIVMVKCKLSGTSVYIVVNSVSHPPFNTAT